MSVIHDFHCVADGVGGHGHDRGRGRGYDCGDDHDHGHVHDRGHRHGKAMTRPTYGRSEILQMRWDQEPDGIGDRPKRDTMKEGLVFDDEIANVRAGCVHGCAHDHVHHSETHAQDG